MIAEPDLPGVALLEADRVSKTFGGVVALDEVSLAIESARVTCLLGDNGAGKSTLVKILSGVYQPSAGKVWFEGESVAFGSPREARARGVATVHQDLALIPVMSVWRNFFLGSEPTRGRLRRLDAGFSHRVARQELARMGIEVDDPRRAVATLSGGERQAVSMARALYHGARVLLLDEPTAALGVRQASIVLDLVIRAKERGVGVLLITHQPRHALPVGDRFVILRRGRVIESFGKDEGSVEEIAALMAGEESGPAG